MQNSVSHRDNVRLKITRAQESLEEAVTLLDEGADLNFVMNSLYYAFLYPVLGLLQAVNVRTPTQGVAIDLFEREFVKTGEFDVRFLDAMRLAFELRPSCACEGPKKITKEDIEQLLPVARDFLVQAQHVVEQTKRALP